MMIPAEGDAERVFQVLIERPTYLTTIARRCGLSIDAASQAIGELAAAGKIVYIGYRWRPRVLSLPPELRKSRAT